MSKSKYGNYYIKVDGKYYIYECLTDIGDDYHFVCYPRKWSFHRFRSEVSKRHVIANKENRGVPLFYEAWKEVTIFSRDAFIKDLGHEIYLTRKWGGDPHKQRVFYHKKGDKGYEII